MKKTKCTLAKANVKRAVAAYKRDHDKWPLYGAAFGEVDRRCLTLKEVTSLLVNGGAVASSAVVAMRRRDWIKMSPPKKRRKR